MLALKLALVPSLICAITLAGRQWGPAVAGWLSGFPVIAGPILFFVATEQGDAFAVTAAAGTLSGVPALLSFVITYAWAATRADWLASLAAGLLAYSAAAALLYGFAPGLYTAGLLGLACVWVAPRLFPGVVAPSSAPALRYGEVLLRMLAGAGVVLALTHFAPVLGPRLSGLLGMFPMLGGVLAVFSHRHAGAQFAIHLLRGMALGLYALVTFCFVLAAALPWLHIGAAFTLALGSAALAQALTRYRTRST